MSDCPRCAALTRERDEARAQVQKFGHELDEQGDELEVAERDLAQARQALGDVTDTAIWLSGFLTHGGGGWEYWEAYGRPSINNALDVLPRVAREALIERGTEQDLGGSEAARAQENRP